LSRSLGHRASHSPGCWRVRRTAVGIRHLPVARPGNLALRRCVPEESVGRLTSVARQSNACGSLAAEAQNEPTFLADSRSDARPARVREAARTASCSSSPSQRTRYGTAPRTAAASAPEVGPYEMSYQPTYHVGRQSRPSQWAQLKAPSSGPVTPVTLA
jgi:cell division septation protein DedD